MNALLEQLHDIEGLDSVNLWPLAIGWWVMIAFGIVIFAGLICFLLFRLAFKRSWRNDTIQRLTALENNLTDQTTRETIIALSEYLRRIVLRRFSRKECAGLMGNAWLKWLALNDPKKFDWETKGILLTEMPYSPLNQKVPVNQIKELIQAVRDLV